MRICENVPISTLTTMRLGGTAKYVLEIEDLDDVKLAYDFATSRDLPVWLMGGGANTIGHDEGFNGVIIRNELKGIKILSQTSEELIIRGMGGENWDDFVEYICARGYSGVEAMSLIPGTLGAAPVQNIGAYGQDVARVVESVEAYDRVSQETVKLQKSELGLGYRKSRFNTGEDVGRFFIVSVTLKLRRKTIEPPFYNSLQRYIDEHGETDFSPMSIRRMVIAIRQAKLPDPEKEASAGSFFKNVLVPAEDIKKLKKRGIPVWENADGTGKINSGWLIEQCGLKGRELHGFRVSGKAALVLINEGAKTYAELAAARDEIITKVYDKFGFRLEQEPVEITDRGVDK